MRTAKVILNGQTYEVQELRRRANQAWRKSLEGHFQEVADRLEGAPGVDLGDGKALAELVRSLSGKLIGSVDILVDLVHQYAPELPIDDDCYDSEVLGAFTAIAGLAYPFGSVVDQLLMRVGSMKQQTGPSSPSPNGGDGTTS